MAPPLKKKVQKQGNNNSFYENAKEEAKNKAVEAFSTATGVNKDTILYYILNQDSVTYLLGGVSFLAAPLGPTSSSSSSSNSVFT